MRHVRPVLVALTILVAACSGDDDDSDGPAAGTTGESVASTTSVAEAVDPASVAAVPSSGCAAGAAVPAGETQQAVRSGGASRTYAQHVPPAYDGSTPLPVIVDFHGYSEGGAIHVLHSALGPYGAEEGFLTISPDSGYPVPRWSVDFAGRDVSLFGDLLDQLEADLCLDTSRVFVTGLSNGAFMTSALACAYSDRIAAVAPIAGIRDLDGCEPDRPVPVIAFHGTADTFVSFDGGLGSSVADLPAPDGSGETLGETPEAQDVEEGPSIPEVTAAWAGRNGCDPEPVEETVADDVTVLAHACPPGAEVELYVIDGGGHTWPGSEFDVSIESIVGPVTSSISANELMWDFFLAHPLPT